MSAKEDAVLISEFLLQLYQDTEMYAPEDFKKNTLLNLNHLFQFDFSAWGGGHELERTIGNVTVVNQVPELFTHWMKVAHEDAYCDVAFRNLNHAVLFDDAPGFRDSFAFNEHWRRFDAQNMLATIMAEPLDHYVSFLGMCNADRKRGFSRRDRWLKELIMPHMANALRKNYQFSIAHAAGPGMSTALVDKSGVILTVKGDFHALFREEKGCMNGRIPSEILPTTPKKKRWIGRSISIAIEPLGTSHFVLQAQSIGPQDALSPRAMEVAQLYAKGLSYKELAKALDIAPATVRNHIAHIYECLGVNSKVELAAELSCSV